MADYGCFCGQGIVTGAEQTQLTALWLKVLVGIIHGALCLLWRRFSEGDAKWHKQLLAALGCLLPGGWVVRVAVF